jgi:Fe-S cluster assembly ATPase SufC
LDEIDSGLDIDALRDVSAAVNGLRKPDRAVLMITHYQARATLRAAAAAACAGCGASGTLTRRMLLGRSGCWTTSSRISCTS